MLKEILDIQLATHKASAYLNLDVQLLVLIPISYNPTIGIVYKVFDLDCRASILECAKLSIEIMWCCYWGTTSQVG